MKLNSREGKQMLQQASRTLIRETADDLAGAPKLTSGSSMSPAMSFQELLSNVADMGYSILISSPFST